MVYLKKAVTFLMVAVASAESSLRPISHRKLSFEIIAGYEPKSLVTDHNAIDLDQDGMQKQLALGTTESYGKAKEIYTKGAFSKSFARVKLSTALLDPLNDGSEVTATTENGNEVIGKIMGNFPTGSDEIDVQYQTFQTQNSYVGCQVGANPTPFTEGCFAIKGNMTIIGEGILEYNYNPLEDNQNKRTLQGFSTDAKEKMHECDNCPYSTYSKFYNYYGEFDYANQWVLAAFAGSRTTFKNGNANFGLYGYDGRTEAIKKGTAYMSVWMYVIREMEDALDDCKEECLIQNCNDDPVHAWDEAVAFYSGSLESFDGNGPGVLLHQLADTRCQNFKTCGSLADEVSGRAHVNIEIFRQFKDGQRKLLAGECKAARANKERIEELMAIPLIQGTLRYAYLTDTEKEPSEMTEAEGAVFAASVLPLVHSCSEKDSSIIAENMKVGQGGTASFKQVKAAFERNYECMKLRCEDIGGFYDSGNKRYFESAEPCGSDGKSEKTDLWLILGIVVGGIAFLVVLVFAIGRFNSRKEKTVEFNSKETSTPEVSVSTPADLELNDETAVIS